MKLPPLDRFWPSSDPAVSAAMTAGGGQLSFAGARLNGEVAPIPVVRGIATEPLGSARRSFSAPLSVRRPRCRDCAEGSLQTCYAASPCSTPRRPSDTEQGRSPSYAFAITAVATRATVSFSAGRVAEDRDKQDALW
jgi:hypothetical protein